MAKTITQKMWLWIIGCTLLAFAVFNMASFYFASQEYYDHLTQENQTHTRNVALSLTYFYETAYRVVGEMAQAQQIKSMDIEQQQDFLKDRYSQHGIFDNILIQRVPDGLQTARVRGEKGIRPDRWWFRKLMAEKKPFVSPSFYSFGFDIKSPTLVTGIVFPIMQGETMVAGLAAFIRIEEVQARVGKYYSAEFRDTFILDENGRVIAHPEFMKVRQQHDFHKGVRLAVAKDEKGEILMEGQDYRLMEEKIEVAPELQQVIRKVLSGESGSTEYTESNGEVMLCSYQPVKIPGYGASWAAVTLQNKNLAMGSLKEVVGRNALLTFIVLTWLAGMLIVQSREMEKGAQQLAQTNATLEEEIRERIRAEADVTASNEELTAMNEEMSALTEALQNTNQQMGTEIEKRQGTEEKLRLRERQFQAMTRLITENNASVDVQMQSVLNSALNLVEAVDGYISLMEKGRAMIRYVEGNRANLLGQEFDLKESLLEQVLGTGKMQYVEDYHNFSVRKRGNLWETQSTAVVFPVKRDEKVVGGLTITWQKEIHHLSTEELEMLQQFADLASLALQGANLREELSQELRQREQLHQKISHMAYHDSLTGLPNRACLIERLNVELEAVAQGMSDGVIFFIDLDELKNINDNFGHFAGDRLIISTGEMIQKIAGEKSFVARLGGDEFIVLVADRLETQEIARMGDRLVEGLCREYPVGNRVVRVSASVGIAVFPQDGVTVEELLKKADNAMYAAKAAGRNCWRFFDPAMLREAQEKLLLTNSLRRALARKELKVVYQPQIDLHNQQVTGFETLLRWHSEEHGIVAPGRFIPLAEQSRLILPIGMWVLQQACGFAQRLSQLGYPQVRVAVNLSAKQLADDSLINDISELLASTGIDPQQLELEITESALLFSMEDGSCKLHQLVELGIRLALDDFGTGYSSLTHLRLFPVETLKIDKSFIDNIPESETDLVAALIHFAQSLKMNVVAEGVERKEQWDYLHGCGCDLVQGYYMSRPIPEEEAVQFLLNKNG